MIGWVGAAWLLLAGSTVLLFVGLPVAFAFLAMFAGTASTSKPSPRSSSAAASSLSGRRAEIVRP